MINRKFLNYKTYNAFLAEKNQIPQDSIVFIQDKLCIWARGKEYICDGQYTADAGRQSLKFKNGNDKVVFSITIDDRTLTLTDTNGRVIEKKFALSTDVNEIRAILNSKQDALTAGYGIDITNNIISSRLDGSLFVIVSELPDIVEANPNKIYIKEYKVDDEYKHEQWRAIDGEWVIVNLAVDTIDYEAYFNQKLGDYALLSYVNNKFNLLNNYAPLDYVNDTFVKKVDVYNPDQGDNWGSGEQGSSGSQVVVIQPSTTQIDIDSVLSLSSSNPVENRIITRALNDKIDQSQLNQYAKKIELQGKADRSDLENIPAISDLEKGLATKQDILTAGEGIRIQTINGENIISSTIDTNMWIVVDELPEQNINENKIYLVQEEDNGEIIYAEYRYSNGEWIRSGQRIPEVDLSGYLTTTLAASTYLSKTDAAQTYQVAGNYAPAADYALAQDVEDTYQVKGNYIDYDTFEAFRLNIDTVFQRKGGYALASDVSTALTTLQQIIDQKYVLKKDVYNPANNEWSSSEPAAINIAASSGQSGGSSGGGYSSASNMVTLTVDQYDSLVRANLVDENTYYFTYEDNIWTFGGTFPITLT